MRTCESLMTNNPVCCLPGDTVVVAAKLMERENIGSIPVIESEQTRKLVGIVTDRDLAMKVVAQGYDAKSVYVESVMTRKLITCQVDDDIQRALDAMSENQLRRIPVVNNENRIMGIIAQADVATRVNEPEKTAEIVKDISQANQKE